MIVESPIRGVAGTEVVWGDVATGALSPERCPGDVWRVHPLVSG